MSSVSTAEASSASVDRGVVIARSVRQAAAWSARVLLILVTVAALLWLVAQAWVAVFPLIMALIVSTVLWPPARFLRRHGWPAGLAAAVSIVAALAVLVGVLTTIAPSVVEQSVQVVDRAGQGIVELQQFIAGPPLNLDSAQVSEYADRARSALQDRGSTIAAGVFTGVAALGNFIVTLFVVLVLTFFFLKDGTRFLPALHGLTGRYAGQHLVEVCVRVWNTVSGFIRTQALVGVIDAVLIGGGLFFLGVPLAFALAVLTFFAAFVPVVGAFVAGGFAVLVALVSNGLGTAALVVLLVLVVQQLEGNVLLPVLQSKTVDLHPGVVLVAIVAGSTWFGVVGAFLAVPVTASFIVVLRYYSEQVDLLAGSRSAQEATAVTSEGKVVARRQETQGAVMRSRIRADAGAEAPASPGGPHSEASPENAGDPAATGEGAPGGPQRSWWRALLRRGG
ncbi:MAG TPA: AI-2E family transporter [Ornithinimicrobium sp.]|uniref:AI-2E family transporter n=1 Tax=Ornithinimicrobium sp. TaxID=1977084 RepID=UPI002B4A99F8|nr:AI-2E family transporter [Ornithinimicrobium sp.]HKJ11738.1 AI-2E family transporter [Ornithinimicrobium sp.]